MERPRRLHRSLPSPGFVLGPAVWLGSALASAAETCLPYAVPAAQRTAVPTPLRIFDMGWRSVSLISHVLHILVTEVLGVNASIEISGTGSVDGLYAAAGCNRSWDTVDRGCPSSFTEHHDHAVLLEVWLLLGRLAAIAGEIPGLDLEDLGSIGYVGTDGFGGRAATLNEAYQSRGLALEYFKSYDASWERPWVFFSNLTSLDSSRLAPCNRTSMADRNVAATHLQFTNDTGGVSHDAGGGLTMRCWDGVWWRSPMCRESPETCIPVVTGGTGWGVDMVAMQAAVHSMPLAIAVGGTFDDYAFFGSFTNSLFYKWEPDSTFVQIAPFTIVFPPHDPEAYARLDKRTSTPNHLLSKVVTPRLAAELPMVYKLANNMYVPRKTLDQLLLADNLKDAASTSRDVACDWIKANEPVWRRWVPDATACIPRMGMVDSSEVPVLDRANASSCQWCVAGTYSEQIKDSRGATHVCRQCPPGQHQGLPGQLSCESCGKGTYAEAEGTVHCPKCKPGSFTEGPGQARCEVCPPGSVSTKEGATECLLCSLGTAQNLTGRTTCERCTAGRFESRRGAHTCSTCDEVLLGSTSAAGEIDPRECTCRIGFFKKPNYTRPECEQCVAHDGLECPGGIDEPLQVAGHWVEVVDRSAREYSVFLCRNDFECPRGPLGACARGRHGKACNSCVAWHYPVSSGMCQPCMTASVVPLMCFIFIGPPVAVLVALAFMRRDATTQQLSTLTIFATAGQLITSLQVLGSLHQLQVRLVDPAKLIVSGAGLLAFDLDFLRVPCFFQRDDPIAPFMLKLSVLPALAGLLAAAWLTGKIVKRPVEAHSVFNAMGTFSAVFFISITLAVLLPLQCRPNPNGRLSMLTEPGIECFNSKVHWTLVALSVLGVLAFPVTILTWAMKATLRFSSLTRTEKGLQTLRGQRFFFARFKPNRHYFAVVLFIRNALCALIPVLLVGAPAIQCSAIGLVLLLAFSAQASLSPWRTHASNLSALLLDGFLITAVVSVGPTIPSSRGGSLRAISWYVAFCTFGMLGATLCFLCLNVYKRLRRVKRFGAFLCHHKAGAGVLARQIKMLLRIRCRSSIFLDSDELDDLEVLFDVVRSETWNLVVLLSGDVLSRVWCAGEIVTAHRNDIRTVVMAFDSCELPSEAQIRDITSAWTVEEQRTLMAFDITVSMVAAAYAHLASAPQIRCSRATGTAHKGAVVQELVSHCQLPTWHFAGAAPEFEGQESEAAVLVLGAVENMEALASCEVLQMMLQEALQLPVKVARSAPRGLLRAHTAEAVTATRSSKEAAVTATRTRSKEAARSRSNWGVSGTRSLKESVTSVWSSKEAPGSTLVVVLTEGLLEDATFAQVLLGYYRANTYLVPVLADCFFQFPTAETYAKLEDDGLPPLGSEVGARLVEAYSELFASIALPFSTLASEAVLKLEVAELCRRRLDGASVGRLKSQASGPGRSQVFEAVGESQVSEVTVKGTPAARPALLEEELSDDVSDFGI